MYKFRAYDKINKLMWNVERIDFNPPYVELSSTEKQSVYDCLHCKSLPTPCHSPHYYCEDRIILMQSTGLFDKNKKEIFEGDIVEFNEYYIGDNRYASGRAYVVYGNCEFYLKPISPEHDPYIDLGSCVANDGGVVIGNIYENPDLIERQ